MLMNESMLMTCKEQKKVGETFFWLLDIVCVWYVFFLSLVIFVCVSYGRIKRWNQRNLLVISLYKQTQINGEKNHDFFVGLAIFFFGSPTTLAMKFTAKPLMVIELWSATQLKGHDSIYYSFSRAHLGRGKPHSQRWLRRQRWMRWKWHSPHDFGTRSPKVGHRLKGWTWL